MLRFHAFCIMCLLLVLGLSCGLHLALSGAWFTLGFCDQPGACGQSGHMLRAMAGRIYEISSEYGQGMIHGIGDGLLRGFFFEQREGTLYLYIASTRGLEVYGGHSDKPPLRTIPLPECDGPADVVVVDNVFAIVSCKDNSRLVKVDIESGQMVASFYCCDDAEPGFAPQSLAVTPEGLVLAGTRAIEMFDPRTGDSLGVVVGSGVEGAESYFDFVYGPNGNLFVSAQPDVGVLEFDGASFEFLRIVIPASEEGIPSPGALAFSADGTLYVSSYPDSLLREFDADTGDFIRQVDDAESPNIYVYDLGARP